MGLFYLYNMRGALKILFWAFLFLPSLAHTQVLPQQDTELESVETDKKHALKIRLGFPTKPIAGKSFKSNFRGVFFSRISYQKKFLKHFVIGPYFDYYSYNNAQSDSIRPSLKREITKNTNKATGLEIGFEKPTGKKNMLNLIFNAGYIWGDFTRSEHQSNEMIVSYKEQGENFGFSAHWHHFIEASYSIGPMISYQYSDVKYRSEILGFDPKSIQPSHHLFIGFVMSFGF